jgi:hypothetical protein
MRCITNQHNPILEPIWDTWEIVNVVNYNLVSNLNTLFERKWKIVVELSEERLFYPLRLTDAISSRVNSCSRGRLVHHPI